MNLNPKAQSTNVRLFREAVSEKPCAGDVYGTSVTSMPGTSTEGLSVDSNQAGASGYTPFNLNEIMESLAFADDDTEDLMEPPKTKKNDPEQDKFKRSTFELKINDAETETETETEAEAAQEADESREVNENDGILVQRKNIYDTITIEPDIDLGDYIQFPDVQSSKKLMSHESFNKIKSQFLRDIKVLKLLVHFFVNNQYDNKIDAFHKKVEENKQAFFHSDFFLLYKETRRQLRCLIVKLDILQDNKTIKDYVATELHKCLEDIDLCMGGVRARFSVCHIDLNASKAGLDRKLLAVRTNLFHQCIMSFVTERERSKCINIFEGVNVHLFTSLNNFLCASLNVPRIEDRYTSDKMVKKFTDDFTVYVQLAVCNSAIIRELLNGWSDEISSTLDNLGASEWKTKDMDLSDIKTEITDVLDSKIFNPISSFMSKTGKDMLNIYDLMDVKDDTCCFMGYRELFFRWLTINFCMSKDNDQSKPEFTVFAALPGITSSSLYIGTIDGVFFWVFKGEQGLKEGQECNSDRNNHITLELSHLTSVNFSSKPDKLIYALMIQAMEQTNKVEDIASFLLNPEINKQLGQKTRWLRLILSNQLTDKLAHNDREFKTKLCECIGIELNKSNKKSISKEALFWLNNTLLLEPVLLKLQELEINITPITQSLTVDDIRYFSIEGITQFLTPKHCRQLFRKALTLNRRAVVLSLLLTEHCDQLVKLLGNKNGPPLFFFASHGVSSGIKYLLRKGFVNVNEKDINGNTALMITAQKGYTDCLKALLDKEANANVLSRKNITPLHYAVVAGHVGCVSALADKTNILCYSKSKTGNTPLHVAAQVGQIECLNVLLALGAQVNAQSKSGTTSLHWAASKGRIECLNALLAWNGIQVDMQDLKGNTAPHYAAYEGHIECLNALLAWGVQVDVQNAKGSTPLHWAANRGHIEIVKALLNVEGIQVNVRNDDGYTPFQLAIKMRRAECVNLLRGVAGIMLNEQDFLATRRLNGLPQEATPSLLRRLLCHQNRP